MDTIYNITGMLVVLNLALSAFAFGYMGWRASKRALPLSALFGYVSAFFTTGLTGIAAQLVFG
jgi:hypothetical protein